MAVIEYSLIPKKNITHANVVLDRGISVFYNIEKHESFYLEMEFG